MSKHRADGTGNSRVKQTNPPKSTGTSQSNTSRSTGGNKSRTARDWDAMKGF